MSFSGMRKLKFLKVSRTKSTKNIKFFFVFHFRILNFFYKKKKDNMRQDIATAGLEKLGVLVHESSGSSEQVQENVVHLVILCSL